MKPSSYKVALGAVFLLALAIRMPGLNAVPGDYHPIRQYQAAMRARAFYVLADPTAPAWKRGVAQANLDQIVRAEPPIMERISGKAYAVLGSEQFWVPRILVVLSWLGAGAFLVLLARRFIAPEGVLMAVSFLLLAPYTVILSTSIQPDSTMIMGLLAGLLCFCRYFDRPTTARALAAGVVAGLAVLVKPGVTIFSLAAAFAVMSFSARGVRNTLRSWHSGLIALMTVLPSAGYMISNRHEQLRMILHNNFMPGLLPTLYFWKGWAGCLLTILGPLVLVVGGMGVLLLPRGLPRAMAWGWGVGYALQSLVTTYTTPSHEYWHAQMIPLFAMGLGYLGGCGIDALRHRLGERAAGAAFAVALAAWMAVAVVWTPRKAAVGDVMQLSAEIGETIHHSTRTIILDHCDGRPAFYFGWFSGWPWPFSVDIDFEKYVGIPAMTAEERFRSEYAVNKPEYFVISRALSELDRQPDLKVFLDQHFPVLVRKYRYIIYDLRGARAP